MTAWVSTGQYTVGYRPVATTKISTSRTELLHLLVAGLVLTFAMAVIRQEFTGGAGFTLSSPTAVLPWLGWGLVATLTAFVAHEMAHKISAQRHGFWAEFRMSPLGLLIALFTVVFIGALFAAPGATLIGGMGDPKEWGRTSLAGPTLNLVEGAAFGGAAALTDHLWGASSLTISLVLLTYINCWFSAFNLLPFGPLDGRKVFRWSRSVWVVSFAVSAAAAGVAFFLALTFP